jgi:outer membrane protein W
MKRLLLFGALLLPLSALAQAYKPFKVTVSVGYVKPTGRVSNDTPLKGSGGGLVAIEPKYSLTDKLEVGLRLETTVAKRIYLYQTTSGEYSGETELKGAGSALATLNYFFSAKRFRPYVGVGGGLFYVAGTTVSLREGLVNDTFDDDADYKPGLMGRVGFKLGHLNVAAEYNAVPKSTDAFRGGTIASKTSYLSLKLGVDFGGGRN